MLTNDGTPNNGMQRTRTQQASGPRRSVRAADAQRWMASLAAGADIIGDD